MTDHLAFTLVRPLPHPLAPFPRETQDSYLYRLSAANKIPVNQLQAPSRWLTSRLDYIDRLSILGGQPRHSLIKAIPLLDNDPRAERPADSERPRWACRRCVAKRTGATGPVEVWMSRFHDQICIPHRLWIGRAVDFPSTQLDVSNLPELITAQRRHYRLLHHHGPVITDACYEHCAALWSQIAHHRYRISERADHLLRLVTNDRNVRPWDPLRYAAVYPEIVETIALFATPDWRKLAVCGNDKAFTAFRAEFARRLPQESPLRTTGRPWFLRQLRRTAGRIDSAIRTHPMAATEKDSSKEAPLYTARTSERHMPHRKMPGLQ